MFLKPNMSITKNKDCALLVARIVVLVVCRFYMKFLWVFS